MMKKRVTLFAALFLLCCIPGCALSPAGNVLVLEKSFVVSDNQITICSSAVTDTFDILLFSDTHLFAKDNRETLYEQYSKRMSEAYNVTRHYKTGEETTPSLAFLETIRAASEKEVDLLAVFSGHIHQQTLDVSKSNLPMFVGKPNFSGNYYNVTIMPILSE